MANPIVETYSRLAQQYDDELNVHSCWGRAAERALASISILPSHRMILDVGCGTGKALADLASRSGREVQFVGMDPAENMRRRAAERCGVFPNVRIVDGCFESIPIDSATADYLYSILAFHWTTDLERSVREIARVLKPTGEMDLFFIGRYNGREFIEKTTPIFWKYLGPKKLLESARLRKQLTRDAAFQLFAKIFDSSRLSVDESHDTYYDDLEGHWGWWVRIEGHFLEIPPDRKQACDQEVRAALQTLAAEKGIPYTIHQLHVRLRSV